MKKYILYSLISCLFFSSCKKENDFKTPQSDASIKKHSVKFKALGFSQSVENFGKKLSKASSASATTESLSSVGAIVYMLFDSEGVELHRLRQYNDGDAHKYFPSGDQYYYPEEFGVFNDTLAAGTYTIVMIATPVPEISINYYTYENNEYWEPLSEAYFEYIGGLDNWSRSIDTFFKRFTVTVADEPVEQDVTLERIVGKVEIQLEDLIPENADHFRFYYNGENIAVKINTLTPYEVGDDEFYSSSIPISQEDKGQEGYSYGKFIVNTITPIEVVINCYDADNNLLASKTVNDVRVFKNKRTILKGKLFDSSTPTSFVVTVNDEWDEEVNEIPF